MKRIYCYLLLLVFLASATIIRAQNPLALMSIPTVHGQDYALSAIQTTKISVFFFLAPECPLCENYAVSIRELRQQFAREEVSLYGIFAGDTYSADEITQYMARFRLPVKALRDGQYELTRYFGATVTPEVFVVNERGELLYQGKIDNWIAALGKKRQQTTRFYLRDALEASLKGQAIAVTKTEAVGCLIE